MTVSNPLAVKREDRLRQALQARYARADRITSGQHRINVRILRREEIPGGMEDVPGWTDGKTISLNDAVLDVGNLTDSGLIAALGVNLHELAHVMFTPNMRGNFADAVRKGGDTSWHAFNILEDQRAETFFSHKFSDARKFYTNMVFDYLLKSEDQWDKNFVLLYGRRYLPFDLMQTLRAKFVRPDLVGEFEDLIDEYRSLADPESNITYSVDIVNRFAQLIRELNNMGDNDLAPMSGHSTDPQQSKSNGESSTVSKRELRKLSKEAKDDEFPETARDIAEEDEGDDEEDDIDTDSEASDSDDGQAEDGDDESPGDGDVEAEDTDEDADDGDTEEGDTHEGGIDGEDGGYDDAEGDTEPEDGGDTSDGEGGEDSDGEGDGSDDIEDGSEGDGEPEGSADGDGESAEGGSDSDADEGGDGAGSSGPDDYYPPEPMDDDELLDYLQGAIEDIANSETVRSEVDETRDAARNVLNNVWKPQSEKFPESALAQEPITLDHIGHIKAVTKRLQDARVGAETVLKRDVRSGTLNPLALRKAQPGDLNVFDEWDAGLVGEEGEMDVVILCDMSGSMNNGGKLHDAAFSLYAIKRAFEAVGDTNVTAWLFDHEPHLLYDRNERVNMGYFDVPKAGGGTEPYQAAEDAISVLGTTRSKLRLFIVVTDGQWNETYSSYGQTENLIEAANDAGVVTVLVGLDHAVARYGDHGCQIARDLTEPGDLVDVAGDIAVEMVRRAERGVKR